MDWTGNCFLTIVCYNPKFVMSDFVISGVDCIYIYNTGSYATIITLILYVDICLIRVPT